jgi:hypothetical protein
MQMGKCLCTKEIMNKIQKINPILITGAERSGSTLIARILDMCGVFSGNCNKMYESKSIHAFHKPFKEKTPHLMIPTNAINVPVIWQEMVLRQLKREEWKGQPWMVKGGVLAQFWSVWYYAFPDAKWLIVRRRTGDVIQSCVKTGYMKMFKSKGNLDLIGVEKEEEGWLWWVRNYEKKFVEMIEQGLNCRVIWPERMADGDFQQMEETIEWLGLKWNDKIPEVIEPLLEKSRRV